MCHHWDYPWHHVILIVLTIVPLHFLSQHNQNDIQHDFCHVMPRVFAALSGDNNSVISAIFAFLRSRQLKRGVTSLFWPFTPLAMVLVSHHANSVVNSTTASLGGGKWIQVMIWSCDAISAGIHIIWCQMHHQWYHSLPWVKMIKMRCKMAFPGHVT